MKYDCRLIDARTLSLVKKLLRLLSNERSMYGMYLRRLGLEAASFSASAKVMNGLVMIGPKAYLMASEPAFANRSQERASSAEREAMTSRVPSRLTGSVSYTHLRAHETDSY